MNNRNIKILESIPAGVISFDEVGNIDFVNTSFYSILLHYDIKTSELKGRNIFNEELFNSIKEDLYLLPNGNLFEKEIVSISSTKGKVALILKGVPIFDGNIYSGGIILFEDYKSLDYNLQKEIKEEIKAIEISGRKIENDTLKIIPDQISEVVCSFFPDGSIFYVNESFKSLLGYQEEEVYGKNFLNLLNGTFKETSPNIPMLLSLKENFEIVLKSTDGKSYFFNARFKQVVVEGKDPFYNGYLINITERKRAEQGLTLFGSLFEASSEGIVVLRQNKIILANKAFTTLFGYSSSAHFIDVDIKEFIASENISKVSEELSLIEDKKQQTSLFEFTGKRKDGVKFFASASVSSFNSNGHQFTVLNVRDVSEKKRAQQALRETEEKYRNIIDSIDDFVYTFENINGHLIPSFFAASVERITGYKIEDFLTNTRLFLTIIHLEDFHLIKSKFKNIVYNKSLLADEIEYRIINKHGSIVWVRNRINIQRLADGSIKRIYGLITDISFRKKAEDELRSSTSKLIKLNETKDKFISIVSHDLRTPFTSILGFSELLLTDDNLSEPERKQYTRFIQDSSKSMLSLVNSLLDWTRLQTGRVRYEPKRLKVIDIIQEAINNLMGAAIQKEIKLTSTVCPSVFVYADKNLLLQVFRNLISNAIKFTQRNGSITVTGKLYSVPKFYEFCIKDTGVGIDTENLNNLFRLDAKYTSNGTEGERGSGLGLSLVKEIVEKHNGTIWVESKQAKGSEFFFTMPSDFPNILFIEENKTEVLLYSKLIRNVSGEFNVESVSSPREAINVIKNSIPALIITNHQFSDMTGYELVHEIKSMNFKNPPPVIVLANSLSKSLVDDYKEAGVQYLFTKPMNFSEFKTVIEKVLHEGVG